MEFHEAANIFPLDEESIASLAEDIRQNGQYVPIETLGGKIIDGRRRFLACQKAGVKPTFREVNVPDPVSHVISLNVHRRHLTASQLAMCAARATALREKFSQNGRERMSEGGKAAGRGRPKQGMEKFPDPISDDRTARDQLGKAFGISGKTVDQARGVLEKGTADLIAAVDDDRVAVSTAYRFSGLSVAEQDALAARSLNKTRRPRPAEGRTAVDTPPAPEPDPDTDPAARKSRGKGVEYAHEAINWLSRIPKNDALRKRGFQIVKDWLRRNE